MSLKLRPLSNRLVLDVDAPKTLSEEGIHIPSTAQEEPQIGTVLAAGPGKVSEFPVVQASSKDEIEDQSATFGAEFKRMPMTVRQGDRVLFGKYTGTKVQIDRDEFLVIRETDVLAVLERKEE